MLTQRIKERIHVTPVTGGNIVSAHNVNAAVRQPDITQQVTHTSTRLICCIYAEGLMEENREYGCMKGVSKNEVRMRNKRYELLGANTKQVN